MSGKSFFDFYDHAKAAPAQNPSRKENSTTPTLTVAELTRQIDRAIKIGVPATVLVRGEISNYKHHAASGNAYFTLKDPDACIDCVMFKSERANLKFEPDDGMELIATGRVSVYPQRGKYQLYVSHLQPLGVGALELAFKKLHAKLLAEGFFASERKKTISRYPVRIALLTSTGTAALQDMLKVLRRFPHLNLCIYHTPVQGAGAAEKIAQGLNWINRRCDADLILLGRGGGSLEDLWAFNEECLARAMFASRIPIVTGIGHEIDVSIADLIADHHAHTPTEAAQVATMHWRHAPQTLSELTNRITQALRRMIENSRHRLTAIERHEIFRRPADRLNSLRQLLDDQQRHLDMQIRSRISQSRQRIDAASLRLIEKHPRHRLQLQNQRLLNLETRLRFLQTRDIQSRHQKLYALQTHLAALSPTNILQRGFSITRLKKTGQIIRSVEQATPGTRLTTQLADGQIESTTMDQNQPELFE
ncbi:MAG TPA: exodeoxyribonuclease VII large subunit [Tepidisphaeraceae bacterium]|jgi:exodeoxyribonuclease VII large subunit